MPVYCNVQKTDVPLIIPFGGGVNSTAMVLGALDRGIRPDLIIFSDTGGEKPETYEWLDTFGKWLKENHALEITRVAYEKFTLEEDCLEKNKLPALAYGYKQCSLKYKAQPAQKYINKHYKAWMKETGLYPVKWIGYDLDEEHRIKKNYGDNLVNKSYFQYPLVDWGFDREACEALIALHGMKPPIKSACFFCPANKKHEIEWLAENHPDLFERAIAMEKNANLTSIKGLGRWYNWEEYIKMVKSQPSLAKHFSSAKVIEPCECVD